jgi:poly-gamma-glutamate synthesis protein (capsule biosynthesis protein)
MAKIIIGGDISPTTRDIDFFVKGDANKLFSNVLPILKKADLLIANLETPLINAQTPILKSGSVFGNKPEILAAIAEANITHLNLANNHIFDHGFDGLQATLDAIEQFGIGYSGAGLTLAQASEIKTYIISGFRIGIMSYAENEFSTASENKGGANPLCLIDFHEKIDKIKSNVDFLILLYHGGREHFMYPTPNQKKICNHFVNQGVNLVVCQHSHIGGVFEKISETGYIIYGQGNFLFDPYPLKKHWLYKGYLIEIDLIKKSNFSVKFTPYQHLSYSNKGVGIRLMSDKESVLYLNNVISESTKLAETPDYLNELWTKHCTENKDLYLSILNGHGKLMRKIHQYLKLGRFMYRGNSKQTLLNAIRCETHREIVLEILDENSNKQ